jgi:hypothetical protein
MGMAACSDTDGTTTQAVPDSEPPAQTEPMDATPPASDPAAPAPAPAPAQ